MVTPELRVGRTRRFPRVALGVLVLLVALPIALYLGRGLVGSVDGAMLADAIGREVTRSRTEVEPVFRAVRQSQRTEIARDPQHSHLALECEFDTVDAGWIVQSYEQSCQLRSIDLFAVGGRAEAQALDRTLPPELFGEPAPPTPSSEDRRCASLRSGGGGADTPDVGVLFVPASSVGEVGEVGKRCYQLDTAPDRGAADVSETYDLDALETGQDWLAVVTTMQVLPARDIGCSPWSVVFCGSPWDQPVLS